jgi:pimeloyl-ACP methyl ester carboxylesterase
MRTKTVQLASNHLTGEWTHGNAYKRLVIFCHGFNSSTANPTIVAIVHGLNKKGHDTFMFNFSENTGGFDIEQQVTDIELVATHFKQYDEIILIGASFAALTTAIATRKIAAIKGLVTLNGFFGQGRLGGKHRKTYLKFRFAAIATPTYRKILRYYRRELRPGDITVPVLVVHSKVDSLVSIEQSRDFYKRLTAPKHFVELESADHGITDPADRQKVIAQIHRWLSHG